MIYLAEQLLFPWLVAALVTGFVVGWLSCGPSRARDEGSGH